MNYDLAYNLSISMIPCFVKHTRYCVNISNFKKSKIFVSSLVDVVCYDISVIPGHQPIHIIFIMQVLFENINLVTVSVHKKIVLLVKHKLS